MIELKLEIWFECTYWDWVVRPGNCVECEVYETDKCPHPDRANKTEYAKYGPSSSRTE